MFSGTSEYALRALTELARLEPGDWALSHDLAEFLHVPSHYLGKVLQQLARAGMLESQRGRGGGFRLARPPESITAWEVVAVLDDVRRIEACVMGEDQCSDEDACPLHSHWKELRSAFVAKLQALTIRNLAEFGRRAAPDSPGLTRTQAPLPGTVPAVR